MGLKVGVNIDGECFGPPRDGNLQELSLHLTAEDDLLQAYLAQYNHFPRAPVALAFRGLRRFLH